MGAAGAGKSTFADIGKLYGWQTCSVSDGLRFLDADLCALSKQPEDRLNKEVLGYIFSTNLFYPTLKTDDFIDMWNANKHLYSQYQHIVHSNKRRKILQELGTYMREHYNPTIHVDGMIHWMKTRGGDDWIVSSVRYVNEIERLKSLGEYIPVIIERSNVEPLPLECQTHSSENEWKEWAKNNNSIVISGDSVYEFIRDTNDFFNLRGKV